MLARTVRGNIHSAWILIAASLTAASLFMGTTWAGGIPNPLFGDVVGVYDGRPLPDLEKRIVIRERYARVLLENMVTSDSPDGVEYISLNLFDDVTLLLTKERFERRSETSYTWFGRVQGKTQGQVILSVVDGDLAANITVDGKSYQVRPLGSGIHWIRQIDQSKFPEEKSDDSLHIPSIPDSRPAYPEADPNAFIDVMVVYTAAAAASSGNIAAEIQLGIDETNASYLNSRINQRLRLVRAAQVTYTESGNISTDLSRLTNKTDGYMDDVHTWRETYAADMVSLWVENGGGYCGVAWLMSSVSPSLESNAFSVVARSCATGYYSFGHELGHNMGARHDWYVDNGTTPFPYSHGYVYKPGMWRTVMSYNNECTANGFSCTRIQYWSNPEVTYGGVPTGVPEGQANPADNRKTLDNTALTVANFRQTKITTPDVKANGRNNTVTVRTAEALSITVSLAAGAASGANADWWVVALTPFGWYYYNLVSGWLPGLIPVYQGAMFDLGPTTVLNMSGLPVGTYTFYFGVDTVVNGVVDMQNLIYNSVLVNVTN